MNDKSKKKLIVVLSGVLALALVAGTLAYYTSTNTLDNQMKTAQYGNELEEKFTPKEDWQPGEKVSKEAGVSNTGDYDLFVRIKMSEEWTLKDGTTTHGWASSAAEFLTATASASAQIDPSDGLITDGTDFDETVVYKELAASGWTFNSNDGYWYYNTKLAAAGSTGNLLTSITLAGDTDMGSYTVTKYYTKAAVRPNNDVIGSDPTTQWVVYTQAAVPSGATYTRTVSALDDAASGYAGATYVLTITSEVIQGTKESYQASAWNVPAGLHSAWGIN
ncbi:MAG: BsaA family SipW-dependent biofilm matrix protein [Clostridiales bacterium]|nr:BsaA family SipW-dependent biofilm matrix protein [Clostridiales bacterium]